MKRVCIFSSVHIALDNRVFYREARTLQAAGYDVTLIAVHDKNEVRDGVRIVGLPRVPRWQRPRLWASLLRLALASRADIYHFHDPELLLVAPWLRLTTGRPTIYDIHEVYADFIKVKDYMPAWVRYPLAWAFGPLEPLLARLQSGLIFADEEIASTFKGFRGSKATLFNFPGRDFIEQAQRETAEPGTRPPTIHHLGGHERNRGTRLMVEAFAQVRDALPAARLVLVGHYMPPSLQAEVQSDVDRRGLTDAVTLTGRIPFTQIGAYLKESAVGWVPWQPFPKNQKNIPTKLFEYMAYGLPVVSSDLRSTRPFVRPAETGYLVTANDPDAHAEALLRLLTDPEHGHALDLAGQRLVQELYNWAAMEPRLLNLYAALLS
jgi:glycosyltransferase involved in cell wall biosynthesis